MLYKNFRQKNRREGQRSGANTVYALRPIFFNLVFGVLLFMAGKFVLLQFYPPNANYKTKITSK